MADVREDGRGPVMNEEMASALRRIADGLEIVTKGMRALSATADSSRCGVVRLGGSYPDFPCTRDYGHEGEHQDRDGDQF